MDFNPPSPFLMMLYSLPEKYNQKRIAIFEIFSIWQKISFRWMPKTNKKTGGNTIFVDENNQAEYMRTVLLQVYTY